MKNLYMTHAIRYEQSLKMILPMLRLYNESALIQIKKNNLTSHYISRFNVSLPDITKV